jgi:hypothetical protein
LEGYEKEDMSGGGHICCNIQELINQWEEVRTLIALKLVAGTDEGLWRQLRTPSPKLGGINSVL